MENDQIATITDAYLAAIAGDYTGTLPKPMTKTHVLLEKIANSGSTDVGNLSKVAFSGSYNDLIDKPEETEETPVDHCVEEASEADVDALF